MGGGRGLGFGPAWFGLSRHAGLAETAGSGSGRGPDGGTGGGERQLRGRGGESRAVSTALT